MNNFVAAIDCGTNSTRLLIGDGATTAERLMQITRLGEGVEATGVLSEEAISRVGKTLREYREIIDSYQVRKVRMTATSAARDASNADDFFDLAEEIIGRYPKPRSAMIPLLHLAQEQEGWVTDAAMTQIGELLGTTSAEVLGTCSFY